MMERDSTTVSRRRLLRIGGLAAVGAAGPTAGCVSGLPPLGSQVEIGRVDVPPAEDASGYRRWVPDPATVPDDRYRGEPIVVVPTAFGEETYAPSATIARSVLRSRVDYLGVGFDRYDLAIGLGRSTVLVGEVDPATVRSTMEGTGYAPADPIGEYDVYERPDGGRLVAVTDGTAIVQTDGPNRPAIARLQAVGAGDRPAYHERNEGFAAFSDRVGLSPSVIYGFGIVASGLEAERQAMSLRFDETSIYYVVHLQYREEAAVPREGLRESARRIARDDARPLVEIETEGSLAVVEVAADRLDGSRREVPQITWGWSFDRTARTVTLVHEAGDAFDASASRVRHDHGTTNAQFTDEYERVGPGDELTVEVPEPVYDDGITITLDLDEDSTTTILAVAPEAEQ